MWPTDEAPWGSINSCVWVCTGSIRQGLLLQLDIVLTQRLFLLDSQGTAFLSPPLHFTTSREAKEQHQKQGFNDLPSQSFTKGAGRPLDDPGTGRPLDDPGKGVDSC